MSDDTLVGFSGPSIGNVDSIDARLLPRTTSAGAAGGSSAVPEWPISKKARMPVDRYGGEYNMRHKRRGLALIFNHENFDKLEKREGTNVDCEGLSKALKRLDFDVSDKKDCTYDEIEKHIKEAASQDHSDNDCIAIVILSHGENGYIYAKDVHYKLDHITDYFTANKCPTLAGKPKLFFIQACQGDRFDGGIMLEKDVIETDGDSSSSYKIPIHADFLFSYSTIPGHCAFRESESGSWYIQSLIEELNTNGKKDNILTLLTFVSQRVAVNFETNVPSSTIMDRQKQIPCMTSMLTRMLYFTEKPPSSQ